MGYSYAKEVLIDQDALDVEWKNQPKLVLKYNEAKADAQKDYDEAKETLELMTAKKDLEIRENSDKKPTEAAIANMITVDADIQEARQIVTESKHRINLLQAACLAFDNRKSALENLVKLFGMSYFAEPQANIEDRGKIDDMLDAKATEKMRKRMNDPEKAERIAKRAK